MRKLIVIILILKTLSIYGQNCISESFPLKIGNVFVFEKSQWIFPPGYSWSSYYKTSVSKDSVINGKRYFYINDYGGYSFSWLRVDVLTGNLMAYDTTNSCPVYNYEFVLDSLCVSKLDSFRYSCNSLKYSSDTGNHSIFNQTLISKIIDYHYSVPPSSSNSQRRIDAKFGLVNYTWSGGGGGGAGGGAYTLKGCIIDGILYGDTNTVGIRTLSSEIPDKFSLKQNYPNPFNPSTVIRYQLSVAGNVSLKVFDLLGKEVAQLVNEKQNAGSYAVDFNAAEYNLPSGIYFYTLNAGEFKETKKMVLIK